MVGALNVAGVADGNVERELDAAHRDQRRQPARRLGGRRRREADPVVARVGRAEGEAPRGGALLGDHAVVVVEYLLRGCVRRFGGQVGWRANGGDWRVGRARGGRTSTEMKMFSPSCLVHDFACSSYSSAE